MTTRNKYTRSFNDEYTNDYNNETTITSTLQSSNHKHNYYTPVKDYQTNYNNNKYNKLTERGKSNNKTPTTSLDKIKKFQISENKSLNRLRTPSPIRISIHPTGNTLSNQIISSICKDLEFENFDSQMDEESIHQDKEYQVSKVNKPKVMQKSNELNKKKTSCTSSEIKHLVNKLTFSFNLGDKNDDPSSEDSSRNVPKKIIVRNDKVEIVKVSKFGNDCSNNNNNPINDMNDKNENINNIMIVDRKIEENHNRLIDIMLKENNDDKGDENDEDNNTNTIVISHKENKENENASKAEQINQTKLIKPTIQTKHSKQTKVKHNNDYDSKSFNNKSIPVKVSRPEPEPELEPRQETKIKKVEKVIQFNIKDKEFIKETNKINTINLVKNNTNNTNKTINTINTNLSPHMNNIPISTNIPLPLNSKVYSDLYGYYNKTKDSIQKVKTFTNHVESTSDNIKDQITSNYNHLNNIITDSLNSLFDNITNTYTNSNRRFLISTIEGTKKIILFDTRKNKIETKDFEGIIKNRFTNTQSIEFDDSDLIFLTGGKASTGFFSIEDPGFSNQFMVLRWNNKFIENQGQMPKKRAFHSSIYFNAKLYIIGGAQNASKSYNECESYNIYDKKWESMPSMNTTRSNPSLCIYNNRFLYVFRGVSLPDNYLDSIEYLDLNYEKQGWQIFRPEDPGLTWSGGINSGVVVINEKKILIIGGQINRKNCNSCYVFDPIKKAVFKGKDIEKASSFNTHGTVYDKKVEIFDMKNEGNKDVAKHRYDIDSNMWYFSQKLR